MRGINSIYRQTIVISIVLFLMLFLLTGPFTGCGGGAQRATLSKASGQVLLQKAGTGSFVSVLAGTTLQQGDLIRTQADSSAVIIFFDGSAISLSSDAEITIEQMERGVGSTAIKLQQQIGASSSRVEKLVDPKSRYEIETPAGSALVRGSVMGVMVLNNGTTVVDAISGSCWAVGQGVEVLLTQGMRSIIYVGSAPSSPSAITTSAIPAQPNPGQAPPAFFNIEPFEVTKPLPPPVIPPRVLSPPEVSTDNPSGNLDPYLRLNGTLKSMGTAPEVMVSFQYGTISGFYPYESPWQLRSVTGTFFFDLDLIPFYRPPFRIYFRAKADGGSHGIGYGVEKPFIISPQ